MRIYTGTCVACQEDWVYVRLTRLEAARLLDEAPSTGKVIQGIVKRLKELLTPLVTGAQDGPGAER